MRFITVAWIWTLAILGCAADDVGAPQSYTAGQATAATMPNPLIGDYYQGDGLGLNLYLSLKPDGSFSCQWSGCLGDYGSTSGTWVHDGDQITVKTTESSGLFEVNPLGNMAIINHEGVDRLLLDRDKDLLNDRRMLPFFSFGRIVPEDE